MFTTKIRNFIRHALLPFAYALIAGHELMIKNLRLAEDLKYFLGQGGIDILRNPSTGELLASIERHGISSVSQYRCILKDYGLDPNTKVTLDGILRGLNIDGLTRFESLIIAAHCRKIDNVIDYPLFHRKKFPTIDALFCEGGCHVSLKDLLKDFVSETPFLEQRSIKKDPIHITIHGDVSDSTHDYVKYRHDSNSGTRVLVLGSSLEGLVVDRTDYDFIVIEDNIVIYLI